MKPNLRVTEYLFVRFVGRLKRLGALAVLLAFVGVFAGVSAGGGVAQETEPPGGESDAGGAQQATPLRVHPSPRAVMRAFLNGMRRYHEFKLRDPADLDLALSTLELTPGELDGEAATELAVSLYELVKRLEYIDPDEIPGTEHRRPTWTWTPRDSSGDPLGPTVLLRRLEGDVGNWRITRETLDQVPGWFEDWEHRPPVPAVAKNIADDAEKELAGTEWLGYQIRQRMPDELRRRSFILENWQWLGFAALALISLLFGRLAAFLIRRVSNRVGKTERVEVDRQALTDFERPCSLFVTAAVLLWLLTILGLEDRYFRLVRLAAAFFLAVTGVWAAYRMVDLGAAVLGARAAKTKNRFDDMLVPLVRRTAKVFLTFVGVVYVASFLTDDMYGIVAGLSIGSLAVGFAAKDSIENLFGTVTVLMDKPYQLGDWITVGDIDGTVEEVGFRSTRVRTFYNSVISVPNSRFISAHVDNWGARRYRRIKTMVSLAYGTPPLKVEAFCEAVRELIRKHPYTRKDYYHVYLNQLGASSLDVLLYCFVETPDWSTELREKHRLFLDLLRVAEELGVEIAFPTQTIHLAKDSKDAEGEGFAEDVRGAERMGRELADWIVKEGAKDWEGGRPGPVVIE